jgi:hypothetical protein
MLLAAAIPALPQSKTPSSKTTKAAKKSANEGMREMLLTGGGLLAFDTPKDWVRSDGPGLASFVPEGSDARTASAMIYISGAPIGQDQKDKTLRDYVASDVSGFKAQFAKASVDQEQTLRLSGSKSNIPVYTFRSGEDENTVEQVAYIQDSAERVLTVVLSAKSEAAFAKSLSTFQAFVESFQGSIIFTRNNKKQRHTGRRDILKQPNAPSRN